MSGADKVAAVEKMPNKNPTGELVLAVPGMDEVSVADVTYKNDLTADIYYPPGFLEDEAREPLPFVLVVNIFTREHYQDWYGMARKDCRDNVDWGRLYAASGMAAVFYEADDPSDDVFDLLDYLKRNRRRRVRCVVPVRRRFLRSNRLAADVMRTGLNTGRRL
jgi:hypothetical protein